MGRRWCRAERLEKLCLGTSPAMLKDGSESCRKIQTQSGTALDASRNFVQKFQAKDTLVIH